MPLHVKDAGAWSQVTSLHVKDAGTWKSVKQGFVRDAGTWKQFYSDFSNGSQDYYYVGIDEQFTVPAGVHTIRVEAWGAGGAGGFVQGGGGAGGYISAELEVTAGDVLTVRVGQGGKYSQTIASPGGWSNGVAATVPGAGSGGGSSYAFITTTHIGAGGGGGASDGNWGGGPLPGGPGGATLSTASAGGAGGGTPGTPSGLGGANGNVNGTNVVSTSGGGAAGGAAMNDGIDGQLRISW